jgi:secondary thiamine-phosphate synthase enzyme
MILSVRTRSQTELVDITGPVRKWIQSSGFVSGMCFLYVPHTTAAITINESADPCVSLDIVTALNRMVPLQGPYQHMEGNSPAHVKASMIGSSVLVAVERGELCFGTWQGIFFCEFDGPRTRKVNMRFLQTDFKE